MTGRWALRGHDYLLLLGIGLALSTFVQPVGVIQGFDIETQHLYLPWQDIVHFMALVVPCLAAAALLLSRRVITSPVSVVCTTAIALLACIDIVFLYFRFHFATPDPTWVVITFLLGYTALFLGHLKHLFFPYQFLRAYQAHLPERLQAPLAAAEVWGTLLLIAAAYLGFQGYLASRFLGEGPQYLLIIAKVIELTPLQRIQIMLGAGLVAAVGGIGFWLRAWGRASQPTQRPA